jgi:hypothetical protein
MNLNIVPSNFSKEVLIKTVYDRRDERSGMTEKIQVNKPIEVVFEGVDTNIYKKINEPSEEIDAALQCSTRNILLFVCWSLDSRRIGLQIEKM